MRVFLALFALVAGSAYAQDPAPCGCKFDRVPQAKTQVSSVCGPAGDCLTVFSENSLFSVERGGVVLVDQCVLPPELIGVDDGAVSSASISCLIGGASMKLVLVGPARTFGPFDTRDLLDTGVGRVWYSYNYDHVAWIQKSTRRLVVDGVVHGTVSGTVTHVAFDGFAENVTVESYGSDGTLRTKRAPTQPLVSP